MGSCYFFTVAFLLGLSAPWTVAQNQSCTGGKIYSTCGTACPLTCENYESMDSTACIAVCVEGCFCPEGTVDMNGICVNPADCQAYRVECSGVQCPRYTSCHNNTATGRPACYPDCRVLNGGCAEDQVCKVAHYDSTSGEQVFADMPDFSLSADNYHTSCSNPPYVLCDGNSQLQCDSEFLYCLQQNKTRRSTCVASCLSSNGGCREDQECITQVGDDGTVTLQCLDAGELPSECPAGQIMNQCGAYCQETCEQRVSGQQFACIQICGPPACVCPRGLLLFRDRCVDPRLCHVLLQYPPAISPLPVVEAGQYLYSILSRGSSVGDFIKQEFLRAVSQILTNEGFPDVTVDLHGIYADDGLQIVLVLSGDGVSDLTSDQVIQFLMDNAAQLPLPIHQVSIVDVDRVDTDGDDDDDSDGDSHGHRGGDDDDDDDEDSFWSVTVISLVSVGGALMCLSLLMLLALIAVVVLKKRALGRGRRAHHKKLRVEVSHYEQEPLGEKQKLEFES